MRWILRDAYFAGRAWRRRPMLAVIAITTIAIGIGAATSVFSVVDGVLLRPLAFSQSDRLIAIWQTFPEWKKNAIVASMWDRIPLSLPEFRDYRAKQTSFTEIGIWTGGRSLLTVGDRAEPVRTLRASGTLLATLGVPPLLGRTFLPEEDTPFGPPAALVTYETWQTRFGGDARIVGRVVTLDDTPFTVVGVLPRGLKLGRTTASMAPAGTPTDYAFWVPVGRDSSDYYERTNHSYQAIGRLKSGVTLARASGEAAQLLRITPEEQRTKGIRLDEWQTDQTRTARAPLFVLFAAAALLLLIACVNVATLLLGEAATRETEMAARLALGAARSRIVWQLLAESVLLAVVGSAIGALLSWWGTRVLVAMAPPRIPGLADVRVDLRVLGASLAAALTTGALFGLAPAVSLSSARPAALLRGGAGQSARGRGGLQRALIAVELALSVILLVGAGLLARTLQRISDVDPGFRRENLIVDQPAFSRAASSDSLLTRQFHRDVEARLAALPGVIGVTAASAPPFSNNSTSSSFEIEGEPAPPPSGGPRFGGRHSAQQRVTVPGYFATLGIPLRAGRDFSAEDVAGSPFVAIVSNALARRDFLLESPIGKRVKYQGEWRTIVGVVDDIHLQRLSSDFEATIYTPVSQRRGAWVLSIFIRTGGDPRLVMPAVRKAVAELAPAATTQTVETMESMIRRSFSEERYRALLISLFGAFAALLAAVGMFGVTNRAVARRTRELAIRSALGASAASIARTVLGSTVAGGALGMVAGLFVASVATRQLSPFLFGVSATDPSTYAGILTLLVAVSLGASWVPARRAAKADVADILRGE